MDDLSLVRGPEHGTLPEQPTAEPALHDLVVRARLAGVPGAGTPSPAHHPA